MEEPTGWVAREMPDSLVIKQPKYTWRCQLHPGTYWMVEDHRVPNRFHRWMQKLCFGVVWEKTNG